MKITNPATEEIIREIAEDSASSVRTKFDRAKSFQKKWEGTPFSSRLASIRKFKELVESKKNDLAKTLTSEVGKPLQQSLNEINGLLPRIEFFLENAESVIKEKEVFNDEKAKMREVISQEALGVIGNISAWNYPYFVGSNVFVPALLAGNTVLYKPSEFSTLTGLSIDSLLKEAGVPDDAFITIIGTAGAGESLLSMPLDGIFFTGSYPTGRKIAEKAAAQLMKVQLELGGKDPVYVCEDVDINSAAESTADGAFYNNGQSCCSIERLYVHEKIFDSFVEKFVSTVKSFRIGNPLEEGTYIGPVTRLPQISVLENQISDAVKKGAKLLQGGKKIPGKGYYFEPTVLINVDHSMSVMREESFGPVIGIQKVPGDEAAIRLMNDNDYGLTSGVYTKDESRARRILQEINSGSVYWNCCDRVSPRLPWSGRGHSGIGLTLSRAGIETFFKPKAWHLRG